jgi:signal transduction histidine kinase
VTRRLILAYVALTAVALGLLATPLGLTFAHREHDRLLFDAERGADAIVTMIDDPLEAHTALPISAIDASARQSGLDVVIVDARGTVVLDSARPEDVGKSFATVNDIRLALRGTRASGRSELEPNDEVVAYATVPTTSEGVVNGAVRVTYPTATLDERVRDVWLQVGLLCVAVLATVVLVGAVIARGITRPLRKLEHASDRLGRGDLTARLDERDGPEELRRVAGTFNRMAVQLSDLIESQTQFVANASHQLRSPLTALRLRLENLDAGADPSDREAIRAASAEVTRMSRLVDGLLILASDAAHHEALQPVDVAAVARDRVGGWNDVAGEHDVDIVLDAPETAFVLTLPSAPEQLLDNLIDNALHAAPSGTTITVVVEPKGSDTEIRVLDRGPGLDAEARLRAFDRFWRAPNAPASGTGIGLAIVRQLVEASGGSVRLQARPGGGLSAEVTLPAPAAIPRSAGADADLRR